MGKDSTGLEARIRERMRKARAAGAPELYGVARAEVLKGLREGGHENPPEPPHPHPKSLADRVDDLDQAVEELARKWGGRTR